MKDAMDAVDRVAISPVEIFPLRTEAGTEQIMDKFFAVGAKVEEIYNEDSGSKFDKAVSDQDESEDAYSSDQKKCNTSEGSVKSKRADSLKEALNLYDSAQHNIRMEGMQAAIQNAAEIQAVETAKQTAYSKEIAKNTHKTATAAQASAYHTRQIDKIQTNVLLPLYK